ncbi:MAG: DUF58 domain-containing protein [Terrimicrobiaceae bacterium]|nr:DUF58 domain-containing protein [Terrimicrobiaceae bacterium]
MKTPGTTAFKFLKPEDMRRAASYEFAPKALVEGYFSGRHRSNDRGASTEFRDYRQYAAGDDPRRVDWRVFARSDRLYLRNFHQETSMNCYVLLDSSGSMGFGENPSKFDYASFFAAALCYLVIRGKDRVSLCTFDEGVRFFAPLGSTSGHLHRILHELEDNRPGKPTSLSATLKKIFPLFRQRGSLVILSDFLDDPGAIFEALATYLHRGFRIYLFHIAAPEELELQDRGLVSFLDLETRRRVVTHTRDLKRSYGEAMQAHFRNLRTLARQRQIHHQLARTDTHYFQLLDVLANRPR